MNSDFTSKDTSLWSSGICIVLMASIKFSVDCSLCLDSSVRGFSTLVKYLDSDYITSTPINSTPPKKVSRKFSATFRIKMHGRRIKTALSSRGVETKN